MYFIIGYYNPYLTNPENICLATMKKFIRMCDKTLIIIIAVFAIPDILICSGQKYRVVIRPESHWAFRKFHFMEKGVSLFMRLLNKGSGRDSFKLLECPVK